MKSHLIHQLNKAFENRIRLGIMSILTVHKDIAYNRLKELLEVTDGNLASHLKNLEKLEYITVEKTFKNRKPNTSYQITELGKIEFTKHLNTLEQLFKK